MKRFTYRITRALANALPSLKEAEKEAYKRATVGDEIEVLEYGPMGLGVYRKHVTKTKKGTEPI